MTLTADHCVSLFGMKPEDAEDVIYLADKDRFDSSEDGTVLDKNAVTTIDLEEFYRMLIEWA